MVGFSKRQMQVLFNLHTTVNLLIAFPSQGLFAGNLQSKGSHGQVGIYCLTQLLYIHSQGPDPVDL